MRAFPEETKRDMDMRRKIAALLALSLLCTCLSGCAEKQTAQPAALRRTVETEPEAEKTEEAVTLETIRTITFSDVSGDSAVRDTVSYIAYYGIMNGVGGGKFSPDTMVNRAMIAKVLYEMSVGEAPSEGKTYADVAPEAWYAEAVAWCSESGMMLGISDTQFDPLSPVTRAQLALILHRAAAAEEETAVEADTLKAEEAADAPETLEAAGEAAMETDTVTVETRTGLDGYTDR